MLWWGPSQQWWWVMVAVPANQSHNQCQAPCQAQYRIGPLNYIIAIKIIKGVHQRTFGFCVDFGSHQPKFCRQTPLSWKSSFITLQSGRKSCFCSYKQDENLDMQAWKPPPPPKKKKRKNPTLFRDKEGSIHVCIWGHFFTKEEYTVGMRNLSGLDISQTSNINIKSWQ